MMDIGRDGRDEGPDDGRRPARAWAKGRRAPHPFAKAEFEDGDDELTPMTPMQPISEGDSVT